jgi:deoxycytidylate deaminase
MLVYANQPIVSVETVVEALKKHSDDPVKQVVALAIDVETNTLMYFGVNRLVKGFAKQTDALSAMKTPLHPAKKLLVRHAETDLLRALRQSPEHVKARTAIVCSLQPCMNCVSSLMEEPFVSISWLEYNRHQEEQEVMKPFMYKERYFLGSPEQMIQVPKWIATTDELEEAGRRLRLSKTDSSREV